MPVVGTEQSTVQRRGVPKRSYGVLLRLFAVAALRYPLLNSVFQVCAQFVFGFTEFQEPAVPPLPCGESVPFPASSAPLIASICPPSLTQTTIAPVRQSISAREERLVKDVASVGCCHRCTQVDDGRKHVRGLPECVGPIQDTTESRVFTQRIEHVGLQYYQDNLAEFANCKIIVK